MRSTKTIPWRWPNAGRAAFLVAALLAVGAVLVSAQTPTAPTAPLPPASPAPAPRFVVVLDAAHGGDDAGGTLANQAEKAFTLAMSVRLRSLLGVRGFQVVTTREADTAVETDRRAEIANHVNAQACLSLHATQSGSGIHLFASSLAPAPPTRLPAWRTAQAAWVTRSLALAGVLNAAFQHAGVPVTLGRTSLPTLDSMNCPALALEIAPLRDPANANAGGLDDTDYQAKVAEAVAAALLEWKAEGRQP